MLESMGRFYHRGSISQDWPKCQEGLLELHLLNRLPQIFVRQTQIYQRRVDVFVSQMSLEGIASAATIQKVYGVALAAEMGMNGTLEVGTERRSLGWLIHASAFGRLCTHNKLLLHRSDERSLFPHSW